MPLYLPNDSDFGDAYRAWLDEGKPIETKPDNWTDEHLSVARMLLDIPIYREDTDLKAFADALQLAYAREVSR